MSLRHAFAACAACASISSALPLPTDDPARWTPCNDGGDAPAVSAAEPVEGRPALRFVYVNGRGFGNSQLDGVAVPPDATGVRFKLWVEAAAPAAAMHLWLREKDGDLWLCRVSPQDGLGLAARTNAWREVFAPFSAFAHQPRGDKRRQFLSCSRLMLGFNYASQTVRVADLAFAQAALAASTASEEEAPSPRDRPGRRIAILREPAVPREPGHAEPERLARLLREAGFQPVFLRAADLSRPERLSRATTDLLVLPNAPFFPRAAAPNFRAFLKSGGAFFSLGGYAFDRLCDFDGGRWVPQLAPLPLAREIDGGRFDACRVNTRTGEHGDTMKLSRDQIGVFDPSFLLRNVASVSTAADSFLAPEAWRAGVRLEGPAAIALTGNNSAVFPDVYGRWIPLLETQDRLGRPRGPAAALVLNYAGPYAGSNWAFAGVTNCDLFCGDYPALDKLFVAVCRRLLAPSYLATLKSDFASYRAGETASFVARVCAPSNAPALSVRFRVGKEVVAERPVEAGSVRAAWLVPSAAPDFREFSAELLAAGEPVDVLRSGFTVWSPSCAERGPALRFKDNCFDFNGRPLFFGGANTTGMMWYSDNEDPLVWRHDFERMGDFAMNTLRILHFSPFCNATNPASARGSARELASRPEKTCRQTDAIVQLAQPNQISIFLSLHDWMPLDLSAEDLAAQQDWNRFWATRYRGFPGMMYDIQNEPGTSLSNEAVLRPLYEKWLADKYGSLQAALAAWQGSGAAATIDFAAKSTGWSDLRARDNERFRAWVYARWQRANGEAVKAVAPEAPVTVGHLQNLTASEKVLDTAGVDFLNIHHYGDVSNLRGVLKLIDRRFEGKGFSLGEFGSRAAHSARNNGAMGDPAEESVRHYLAVGHYALGMGAAFVANWSWKDFRDSVFPWGVNHADLTPKPVLEAYRNMMLLFRSARPRYEAPALWLVLPDSFRLGPDSGRIHEGLRRAADWLLCENAPFGVINEESFGRLPAEAKALVWPMAVCPSDEAFARVSQFVGQGGRLLLTGDPRFDEDRRPTRLDRLAKLGLPAVSETPQPPFAGSPGPLAPAAAYASADGRVLWSPAPLELRDGAEGPTLYRRFLSQASDLGRLRVTPDNGTVLAFSVPCQQRDYAVAAVNMATVAQEVVIGCLPAPRAGEVRATLGAGRTLYVMVRGDSGAVVAAAAQGRLEVGGRTVFSGGGDWAVVALDDRDLGDAEQILALPFGAGEVSLARAAGAPRPAGEVGEFRAGRWTVLEAQRLEQGGGALRASADAATAFDLRLFAPEDQLPAARERAERLLRVR